MSNRKSSGEKGSTVRAQALFDKYERKVVDSYDKQIKKLESTYKAIFVALEGHRVNQLNQLRTLQSQQKEVIARAKLELEQALIERRQSKMMLGRELGATSPESGFATDQRFSEALLAKVTKESLLNTDQINDLPVSLNNPVAIMTPQPSEQTSPNTVPKSHLVKLYSTQAWSKLQFATFKRQKMITVAMKAPSGEEIATDGVSQFLDLLTSCLRTVPSAEWDLRRKQKKKDKMRFALPPTQLTQRDTDDGSKKLKVISPSQRQILQPQILIGSQHPSQQPAKIPFLLRNDPLSDSEKKPGLINHEVLLQTSCFGEDLSMIRASQAQTIFDQADHVAIRSELKTLSPQCKRDQAEEPHQGSMEPQPGSNKKHNLQILGKSHHQVKKPANKRYQECASLDRSTLLEHSTVSVMTASGQKVQNAQQRPCEDLFHLNSAAAAQGKNSKVLTGVQQAESNQLAASQRKQFKHGLTQSHGAGNGPLNLNSTKPNHHQQQQPYAKSSSSQALQNKYVTQGAKVVPTVPKKLLKAGSGSGSGAGDQHSSYKGSESQTTEATMGLITNLRQTSGSEGARSQNALATTTGSSSTNTNNNTAPKVLSHVKLSGGKQGMKKPTSGSKDKRSSGSKFSMSHGNASSQINRNQRSQRQLSTRKPQSALVPAPNFGHSHQVLPRKNPQQQPPAINPKLASQFTQRTWMTTDDKKFFQQLSATENHTSGAPRKNSQADEELREMQLRILKEDSEETNNGQGAASNPFSGHQV